MSNFLMVIVISLVAGLSSMCSTLNAAAESCKRKGHFDTIGGERIQCRAAPAGIKEKANG